MLIECLLRREEPVVVPVSNEQYRFERDAHGRLVAEVHNEAHINCFLARSDVYRPAGVVTSATESRDVSEPETPAESTPAPESRDIEPESRDLLGKGTAPTREEIEANSDEVAPPSDPAGSDAAGGVDEAAGEAAGASGQGPTDDVGSEPATEQPAPPTDIAAMTRKELMAALKEAGVKVDAKAKNDALKAVLAATRAAA